MVPLSLGLHSVESQSHSDPMLTSMSRLLSATESQNSPSKLLSQLPPLCSQADACTFTLLPLRKREPHWSSLAKMRRESLPQVSTTSQLSHATLRSGLRKTDPRSSTTRRPPDTLETIFTTGSSAPSLVTSLFATGPAITFTTPILLSAALIPTGSTTVSPKPSNTTPHGEPPTHTSSTPLSGLKSTWTPTPGRTPLLLTTSTPSSESSTAGRTSEEMKRR